MNSAPTVADVLAGARRAHPKPAVQAIGKTVLVAGARGRLGERILARLLASSAYREVYVTASDVMPSTEAKLTALTGDDWRAQIDQVIAVPGIEQAADNPFNRRRTEVFSALAPDGILPLARHARAMGATRFMLVTPIDVMLQPAALRAHLGNLTEAELHRMGFESLLLVRPSDTELRRRQGNLGQRLIRLMVDTAGGLMVGARHTPLSVDNIARATVRALQESGPGLTVLETERLHVYTR
jgi:hypothetical protein